MCAREHQRLSEFKRKTENPKTCQGWPDTASWRDAGSLHSTRSLRGVGAAQGEPNYSFAHAALAWCYHIRFGRGGLHEEDRKIAIHHARTTITNAADDATTLAISGRGIQSSLILHSACRLCI